MVSENVEDSDLLDCGQTHWFGRVDKHKSSKFELTTVGLDCDLPLQFWRPSEYNFYLLRGAVMPWCTLEGATYDANSVVTSTCVEALDIISRDKLLRLLRPIQIIQP